jgi:hypothetical protein
VNVGVAEPLLLVATYPVLAQAETALIAVGAEVARQAALRALAVVVADACTAFLVEGAGASFSAVTASAVVAEEGVVTALTIGGAAVAAIRYAHSRRRRRGCARRGRGCARRSARRITTLVGRSAAAPTVTTVVLQMALGVFLADATCLSSAAATSAIVEGYVADADTLIIIVAS